MTTSKSEVYLRPKIPGENVTDKETEAQRVEVICQ